jgi:phosphatidylethanolamine/phosphatidyl-N-methylethanolamine N-methyltransferase
MSEIDNRTETYATQRRYDRIAPLYNVMEIMPELIYKRWRKQVWSDVTGDSVLEIGVGTGKNIPYYPSDIDMTAIDLSSKMLRQAYQKSENLDHDLDLSQMDAQVLGLKSSTFDTVITTFVFCSIPQPILALEEIKRVLKPDGRVILLEHMRSKYEVLGKLMDVFDPLVHRFTGPHINRETVENVDNAGFTIQEVKELDPFGIFRMIYATK